MFTARLRALVGLCIVWLAQACVSSQTQLSAREGPDELQRRIQTWLGRPRTELEEVWGIASRTEDMGQGLRYLHFAPKAKQARGKGKAKAKGKTAVAQTPNCQVSFGVNLTGRVFGGQWSGDRKECMKFVVGVPQRRVPPPDIVTLPRNQAI